MSDLAIRVEGISKRYRIGVDERRDETLVRTAARALTQPFRNLRRLVELSRFEDTREDRDDVIWAVRDVSFDVPVGQVLGIIGRNGAGKSTLLKILTRITEPTSGRAVLRGRVSSLLEVGTGFHPELTGRDNVYLNGAVLGMSRKEIRQKFDEIVAFSGVERFINTPVKRYSTGMKVRLAFAVAAHLDPEILLIDEVLSVGDAEFQKKCLGKMDDVARGGRTVLFVSHHLAAVTRLCSRVLLLDGGRLVEDGAPHEVMSTYLTSGRGSMAEKEWRDPAEAPGGEVARLRAVRVVDDVGRASGAIDISKPFRVEVEFEVMESGHVLLPNLALWNSEEGVLAFRAFDLDPEWRKRPRPKGRYRTSAWIPENLLGEGLFTVDANLITQSPSVLQYAEESVVAFQVIDNPTGDTARGDWGGIITGVVRPKLEWTTEYVGSLGPSEALAQRP
jgi:lipopolysaccharide transport system ATP-binding protein